MVMVCKSCRKVKGGYKKKGRKKACKKKCKNGKVKGKCKCRKHRKK